MESIEERNIGSDNEFYSQHMQYSEDLWDSLDSIEVHSRKSCKNLKSVIDYIKGILKYAEQMSNGINKLSDTFEKEFKWEDMIMDTTSFWLSEMPNRIRTINEIFYNQIKIVQTNAVEVLEAFYKNYYNRSNLYIQEANKYRNDLKQLEKNIEKTQTKYYKMCMK